MWGRLCRRRSIVAPSAGALLCLVLALPAAAGDHHPSGGPPAPPVSVFPEFEVIQPNIDFWRDVFSLWNLGQVAVHDLEFPALIYDVVQLPGEIEESYSDEQREFTEKLVELWENRLRDLAAKIENRSELDQADKELALLITTSCGTDGIAGAHERVRTQRGLRERFRRGLEIGARYDKLLREIFREAGLPEDLALLPHVESSFQSRARSSAGALGAWQFTRGTGRRYLKITSSIDERLDPVHAARGAARYFADAYEKLGDWALAITSYNHGIQGMVRARDEIGDDYGKIFLEYEGRVWGFASKNFYAEFLAAREIALDPERYFPEGLKPEPPLLLEQVRLERPASPLRLAASYGVSVEQLAAVNPAWTRRAVLRGSPLPAGSRVWIPDGTSAGALPDWIAETTYAVQVGDSLWSIAEMFGLTLERLRKLNGLSGNESRILPGQVLRVFEGEGGALPEIVIHQVNRGDTLLEIATAYGVRLADLLALNRLTLQTTIYPGQQIRVPTRR